MADLFTVTAPLKVRFPNQKKHIMIERFRYNNGLIYLRPFWQTLPDEYRFHTLPGPIKGDGPWKVGDTIVTVLGCHGTDASLAAEYASWQTQQQTASQDYPSNIELLILANNWIKHITHS